MCAIKWELLPKLELHSLHWNGRCHVHGSRQMDGRVGGTGKDAPRLYGYGRAPRASLGERTSCRTLGKYMHSAWSVGVPSLDLAGRLLWRRASSRRGGTGGVGECRDGLAGRSGVRSRRRAVVADTRRAWRDEDGMRRSTTVELRASFTLTMTLINPLGNSCE